ncbi:tyrosine-type recombinase/integrase [Brucella intermedia]|uniref:tyrosine-type recombinase/integrase n=1 Tax=Brucella intermedia TaxID=94625 RepID=UPI00124EDE22|nr:integrase arm-type DNA-binding domain-containing protein [Brucella intermedia]KAB2716913.1 tyrosine-type recombinase/integrase [Brucella intermedia]
MALTDAKCRAAKAADKPIKISDSGGLYLHVAPSGAKLWRLAYRFAGKQKTLAIGSYPQVGLADAREPRDDAKKLLTDGTDPSVQKKLDKISAPTSAANTFEALATEWIDKQVREGRSEKTMARNHRLAKVANREIGRRPIDAITPPEVLEVLRKIEVQGKHETASRMKVFISSIARYAIATGRAESDPTLSLRGALTTAQTRHRAAVTEKDAYGALLRAVWSYDGQPEVIAALKLMALLFPRPGELRQAEWKEFDLDAAVWAIPAARAKMRREHRKPLPKQAVAILRDLHRLTGDGDLVFPGIRSRKKPISENTLNGALRRLGYTSDQATSHGFRASASTLLNETGKWSPDAIERELGHLDNNAVRAAYARGQFWEERIFMMQKWVNYCDKLREQKATK